jgi:CHASE3 domain sensor protein
VVVRPAPPRRLPAQDHPALDAAERAARRFTWVLAGVAGAIALVVTCLLAGRLLS